ncbi:MAG: hypothetical protein NTX06_01765 [Proteobacteria bacterium]|jgi:hypothetical protein|nr:hypothetical protein [Pseudomonadota bacterium]
MAENETAKQDEVIIGEYKGNPVITLPIGPRGGFTFGITKARAILKYLDDIKAFIEKNETKKE